MTRYPKPKGLSRSCGRVRRTARESWPIFTISAETHGAVNPWNPFTPSVPATAERFADARYSEDGPEEILEATLG